MTVVKDRCLGSLLYINKIFISDYYTDYYNDSSLNAVFMA